MEIKLKRINGTRFEFVNEYYENGYSWGHKSTLLINGYEYGSEKIRYYNRTWECYTYQSVMYKVLGAYKERKTRAFLENYLYNTGKTRFAKGEKAKVLKDFEKSEDNKIIKKLRKAIETNNFSK